MFDELLAKMLVQIDEMSADELTNLKAIVNGKIRKRAGRPVGIVPAPISSVVEEMASQLDMLSTSSLAFLRATITENLIALGVKVTR